MTARRPVAVVTGGTRGIGRAIACRLAADGFRVVAAARSAPDSDLERGIEFMPCDVSAAAQVSQLFAAVAEKFGAVDALVNNAGIAGANALDADDALWHAIVDTNLHGTYYCCKAALPLLPDQRGRIVNIASTLGLRGVPDQTAYCAAKHGVVGLTRALALYLAPRGIAVNAICPGWVDTAMAHGRMAELGLALEDANRSVPTGRIATAAEVADAVAFLVAMPTASMTGQTLTIDGGRLASA